MKVNVSEIFQSHVKLKLQYCIKVLVCNEFVCSCFQFLIHTNQIVYLIFLTNKKCTFGNIALSIEMTCMNVSHDPSL